ncbi:MAG: P27 family phage terminase small subunit [Mycobacterium sp.]|uniref:P27 family phage terminase small subunit n=1 Tax=Mycobacterium sp. TaxID=1785 RepID=UPI003BAE9BA9
METGNNRPPSAPKDLQAEGKKLWRDVLAESELNAAETALLKQLCLTVDELAAMKADLAEMGTVVMGSRNQPRVNPLLAAIAAHRKLCDQLVVALGLPLEGEVVGRRRSAAAKQSADARWRKAPARRGQLASVQEFTEGDKRNG